MPETKVYETAAAGGAVASTSARVHAEEEVAQNEQPPVPPFVRPQARKRQEASNSLLICGLVGASMIVFSFAAALGFLVAYNCSDLGGAAVREDIEPWNSYRLPRNLVPLHYYIELTPHFYTDDDESFDGKLAIDVRVVAPTRFLILHVKSIAVTSVGIDFVNASIVTPPTSTTEQVEDEDETESNETTTTTTMTTSTASSYSQSDELKFPAAGFFDAKIRQHFYFEKNQYFVVELKSPLLAEQNVRVSMRYSGTLANNFEGFYKSVFVNPKTGKKSYVAVTNFKPFYARSAFPCFDEPYFRAYFTVSVNHRPTVVALSNMPLASNEPCGRMPDGISVISRFAKTSVPMSPYLLAIAIGPYSTPNCASTKHGLPLCINAPTYLIAQSDFALKTAVKIAEWLPLFFTSNYSLPKLDLVIYPELSAEFVEGWGLISFPEDVLLVSRDYNSDDELSLVEPLLTHAMVYQYFGNLVAPSWWDDIWLIEGVAAYLQGPDGSKVGHHYSHSFMSPMSSDAYLTASSPQIHHPEVKSNLAVIEMMESAVSTKSHAIVAMMIDAFGMSQFREALCGFLDENCLNATRSDLFWEFFPFKETFNSWTEQRGFPVVTVVYQCRGGEQLVLSQERFVMPRSNVTSFNLSETWNETISSRWNIPVAVGFPRQKEFNLSWFQPESFEFSLKFPQGTVGNMAIKLNFGQLAYIRVNYPQDTWSKFSEILSNDLDALDPADRAGLVDDCFEMAKAGRVPYSTVFRLVHFLANETNPLTWQKFQEQIIFLHHMLSHSPKFGLFQTFLLGILRLVRVKIFQEDSDDSTEKAKILRIVAEMSLNIRKSADLGCYANLLPGPNEAATKEFLQLRRFILAAHLLNNDKDDTIDELLAMSSTVPFIKEVRRDVLYALSRTQQPWLLVREMDKIFNENAISLQDFLSLGSFACYSPQSRQLVWNWVRQNFNRLKQRFRGQVGELLRWIFGIAAFFNTEPQYEEFTIFVNSISGTIKGNACERHRDFALERIATNMYWMATRLADAELAILAESDFIYNSLANTTVEC